MRFPYNIVHSLPFVLILLGKSGVDSFNAILHIDFDFVLIKSIEFYTLP